MSHTLTGRWSFYYLCQILYIDCLIKLITNIVTIITTIMINFTIITIIIIITVIAIIIIILLLLLIVDKGVLQEECLSHLLFNTLIKTIGKERIRCIRYNFCKSLAP